MSSKRADIIECFENGLTAADTIKEVKDVTINYVYKVRSEYRRNSNKVVLTSKQSKIIELSKKNISVIKIANQVDCSIQYVYKVLNNKKEITNPFPIYDIYTKQDEYYTPLYAIIPIEKQLKRNAIIWCPFDKKESLYVKYFRQQGHTVVSTHIEDGFDFFTTETPEKCDYIISNPPYSLKERVFKRLFNLDISFAMLVNTAGLFAAKSRFSMFKNGVEMMVFDGRIKYMTSYEDTKTTNNPPFESGYICSRVLRDKIVFEELDRSFVTM